MTEHEENDGHENTREDSAAREVFAKHSWIVLPAEPSDIHPSASSPSNVRVWGLTAPDRLKRGLSRAGVEQVEILEASQPAPSSRSGAHVVFRGDYFFDERLIEGMVRSDETLLVTSPDGSSASELVAARVEGNRLHEAVELLRAAQSAGESAGSQNLPRTSAADLVPAYIPALRKRVPPLLFPALQERTREIENLLFAASYKGLTDLVTKWLWPAPARAVVRQLARRGVRPNTVTALSYVLAILATWLFAEGWFATGLVVGWGMTFLDTVDGKLARVTLTSTRFGHIFDHGLDLVHPPIWWFAWAVGLSLDAQGVQTAMWIVVGGYLVGRALEGFFMTHFRMEIFVWRPVDGVFRTVVARRNPNLLLLSIGVLFARPDLGFFAVASWTVICIAVHSVTVARALGKKRRGLPVRSWYETEGESAA